MKEKISREMAERAFAVLKDAIALCADEDGYLEGYEGMEGYNIADMDIVAEFNTLKQAEDFIEKQIEFKL